jgi:gamma-glutamyl-gamma-aminobutyrate hydrolase PuuD
MNKSVPLFCSLAETPGEGSMTYLLRLAGWEPVPLQEAEVVIFNGGADIGTEIYNEIPIYGGIPHQRSTRDRNEIYAYENLDKNVLKVGICRGGQLLNCLNGGTLWQDVNNHGRDHMMTVVETGQRLQVTSTHHQMMRPAWDKAIIIGVSDEATKKYAEKDSYPYSQFPDDRKDTEIVYYPETHSLCIQGHPEYVPGNPFAEYCIDLIRHYYDEVRSCAA